MTKYLLGAVATTALFLLLSSCIERREIVRPQSNLDRLASWLAGSFSSQDQADADTSFADIRLEIVPIWTERTDGRWLYVERAAAGSLEQPYRQRVYHLTRRNDTTFLSSVYELTEPLRFAGAWRTPDRFDPLTPDSLRICQGCTVQLHPRADTAFVGQTRDEECFNDRAGAQYATSEVAITPEYLWSWDRGYDSTGAQVWGSVKGGYLFRKLSEE